MFDKTYWPEIEKHQDTIRLYAKVELGEIVSKLDLPMESEELQAYKRKLTELNELVNRPSKLQAWSNYLLVLLFLVGIFSVAAYLNPEFIFLKYSVRAWAYVLFLANLFLDLRFVYQARGLYNKVIELKEELESTGKLDQVS